MQGKIANSRLLLHGIPGATFIRSDTRHGNRLSGHGVAVTHLWLITYDISADGRRQKVHNILKDYGKRVQYSVFECHLSGRQLSVLRARLLAEIDSADSLRWYPLCSWCSDTVFFQGLKSLPEDEGFFLQ